MKTNPSRRIDILKFRSLQVLLLTALMFSQCTCDKSIGPGKTESNLMVVYPNSGNVLTFVGYSAFEVVRTVMIGVPDSVQLFSMCLSTNKDYLIFSGMIGRAPFSHYIVSYDIARNTVHGIFPTGLDSVGAPRLTAAYLPEEPGLIYLYSHNIGLYSIDFLSQKLDLISNNSLTPQDFYHSPDNHWIVINKYVPGGDRPGYAEIEFYNTAVGLSDFQFVLNKDNRDSVQIDDIVFSDDATIFISIRLPQTKYVANYFGSYDLKTKKLYKSSLTFPWSLNPYYLAYSPKRKECYMVGAQDKFYIIGADSSNYYLKAVVDLTGKVPGPSRILVSPDEDFAFVSCYDGNFLTVIDLANRKMLKKIAMETPYLMLKL